MIYLDNGGVLTMQKECNIVRKDCLFAVELEGRSIISDLGILLCFDQHNVDTESVRYQRLLRRGAESAVRGRLVREPWELVMFGEGKGDRWRLPDFDGVEVGPTVEEKAYFAEQSAEDDKAHKRTKPTNQGAVIFKWKNSPDQQRFYFHNYYFCLLLAVLQDPDFAIALLPSRLWVLGAFEGDNLRAIVCQQRNYELERDDEG